MRVLLSLMVALCVGCQLTATDAVYGVSDNSSNFGEVGLVLTDVEGGVLQGVPFITVGEGTLPESYATGGERFQRLSGGAKVRYPFPAIGDRIILFVEAGGMVSYYQAAAIGTPYELELMAALGGNFVIGDGWAIDLAGRIRHPTGNGNNHDTPEHAPLGVKPEVVFGLSKDF